MGICLQTGCCDSTLVESANSLSKIMHGKDKKTQDFINLSLTCWLCFWCTPVINYPLDSRNDYKVKKYSKDIESIKKICKQGDILVFGSKCGYSKLIQSVDRSNLSNCAIILRSPNSGNLFVAESVVDSNLENVLVTPINEKMEEIIDSEDEDEWAFLLNLKENFREKLKRFNTLTKSVKFPIGREYDVREHLRMSLVNIIAFAKNNSINNFHKQVSNQKYNNGAELVCSVLNSCKVFGDPNFLNSTKCLPHQLAKVIIFQNKYVQLKGEKRFLDGFNNWSLLKFVGEVNN